MEQKLRRKSLRNRSIHGVQAVVQRACGTQITIRQPLYFGDLYLCIGFCTAYIAFTIVYFYVVKGVEGSGQNHLYDVLDFSSHMMFSVVLVLVVMLIVPFVYYIFVSAASNASLAWQAFLCENAFCHIFSKFC